MNVRNVVPTTVLSMQCNRCNILTKNIHVWSSLNCRQHKRYTTLPYIQQNPLIRLPKRIVFGSCSSQVHGDLSYWDRIIEQRPDLVILMGDNVYAPKQSLKDPTRYHTIRTDPMNIVSTTSSSQYMDAAYKTMQDHPSFQRFINQSIPMICTLDDNDYNLRNCNDHRMTNDEIQNEMEVSKVSFLQFFQIPSHDKRYMTGRGVYTSYDYYLHSNGNVSQTCSTMYNTTKNIHDDDTTVQVKNDVLWRMQIIVFDVRRHTSSFIHRPTKAQHMIHGNEQNEIDNNPDICKGPYCLSNNVEHTILGTDQWEWFETQIQYSNNVTGKSKIPDIRLIISPIQVLSDGQHGWDCWNLFPHERDRLLSLLEQSSSSSCNTIILSGDRHAAGFYTYPYKNPTSNRQFVEIMSSSLTHSVPRGLLDTEYDTSRIGKLISGCNNFGVLQLSDIEDNEDDGGVVVGSIHCTKLGKLIHHECNPITIKT